MSELNSGRCRSAGRIVGPVALLLGVAWPVAHWNVLAASQSDVVRAVLALLFATMAYRRAKSNRTPGALSRWVKRYSIGVAIVGVALYICGLVGGVRQVEWGGALVAVTGALIRARPTVAAADTLRAALLLYWVNPLPQAALSEAQLWLQRVACVSAEYVLQMFRFPAWADGVALRTPSQAFIVEAGHSGINSVLILALVALGFGILLWMRPWRLSLFVLAACFLAVGLNAVQIAVLAMLSERHPGLFRFEALQESASLVVPIGIGLLLAEALLARRYRRARGDSAARGVGDFEPRPRNFDLPYVLHGLLRHRLWIVGAIAVAVTFGAVAARTRPARRAATIKEIALSLFERGELEAGHRAVAEVRSLGEAEFAWELALVGRLVGVGNTRSALDALEALPVEPPAFSARRALYHAYALMAEASAAEKSADEGGRGKATALRQQAEERLGLFSDEQRERNPGLALLLAQLARERDDTAAVVKHLTVAAASPQMHGPIRSFFPYLRSRRAWEAIARVDRSALPHTVACEALAAVEAHMNLDDYAAVERAVNASAPLWPDDWRWLYPLFFLANKQFSEVWNERFAQHFWRFVSTCKEPGALYRVAWMCFELGRPELGWALHLAMERLDPMFPGAPLMAARFGDEWFTFRRHQIGITAAQAWQTVDLRGWRRIAAALPEWRPLLDRVPLGVAFSANDTSAARQSQARLAVARFKRMRASGRLDLSLSYEFARALDIAGDLCAARAELDDIVRRFSPPAYPPQDENRRLALSEIFERRGRWIEVYETLRGYDRAHDPQLLPLLRLAVAQRKLGLGMAAETTARRAVALYPHSALPVEELVATLLAQDRGDEAYFEIERRRARDTPRLRVLEMDALLKTQRYVAARDFAHSTLLPLPSFDRLPEQTMRLLEAEAALRWHERVDHSEESLARHAQTVRHNLPDTPSLFLQGVMRLWLECYESDGIGTSAQPESWLAIARTGDETEEAEALHQLAMLQIRFGRHDAAERAVRMALQRRPDAPLLWRLYCGLAQHDPTVLDQARRHLPDDPELWLAALARGLAPPPAPNAGASASTAAPWSRPQVQAYVRAALEGEPRFPAETLGRAAELLDRASYIEEASLAIRNAAQRARTLLPLHAIAALCALRSNDHAGALRAARDAMASSLRSDDRLLKLFARLSAAVGELSIDPAASLALKTLRAREADQPLWPKMLAFVSFDRGGVELFDALHQATEALERGSTSVDMFIIAAEAARRIGNTSRAMHILRQARRLYPDNIAVANNMALTLSSIPGSESDALLFAPLLEAAAESDARALDTLITVYTANRRFDLARRSLDTLSRRIEAETDRELRVSMSVHRAVLLAEDGKFAEARDVLDRLWADSESFSSEELARIDDLREQWSARRREVTP